MSRYRRIEVRTWADEKFRSLTPIPPCGQGLWFYLLTGPHTGPIPGLFRAGPAAMAEELGWSPEAFTKAFHEVFAKGMVKADFKARFLWVPNALKYNPPANPNVVVSWGTEFELLPECDLKQEAFEAIKSFIINMGEPYRKAFEKAFTKPLGKPLPKTLTIQEQEQEQEEECPPLCDGVKSFSAAEIPAQSSEEADLFRRGKEILGKSSGGLISKLLKSRSGNIALARSAIEIAATKADPREYVGAAIRGSPEAKTAADFMAEQRARGDRW